jgi:excisionase family DNA binding protein
LDLEEAAKLLKVHPKTLQRLAQANRTPACKIGRAWILVERLLVEHLVSESLVRVSVVDLQGKTAAKPRFASMTGDPVAAVPAS